MAGDGSTTYLDSGQNIGSPENHHLACYITSKPTSSPVFVGSDNTALQRYLLYCNTTADETRAISGKLGTAYFGGAGSLEAGFKGMSRANANNFQARSNATTSSVTSEAGDETSLNLFVFAKNQNGTAAQLGPTNMAFYSIGTSLDLAKLDSHITAYVTAIGAAI